MPARSSPNFFTIATPKLIGRLRCWNASTRWMTRSARFTAGPYPPPARVRPDVRPGRFGRTAREAAIYNLDRRPVVLSLFGELAEVA